MSSIKMFRLNGYDPVAQDIEFYYKVNDDNNHVLCNLCIDDNAIYYYKAKSGILTRNENRNTRETYDGHINFEELKDLFEALIKAGICEDSDTTKRWQITRQGKRVVIELDKTAK